MRAQASFSLALAALAVINFSETPARAQSAAAAASRVPLYFEQNQGQTAKDVKFLARAAGYTAYLTGRETVLQYRSGPTGQKDGREAVVRMSLAGSETPTEILGGQKMAGVVNYMIGSDRSQWHARIPTYGEVTYDGVYPGVNLVYRPAGQRLEFDFRVAPGADPGQIQLAYTGASKMHLNIAGDLVLETAAGPATFSKPIVYQEIDSKRVLVAANYSLRAKGQVGFDLGKYDKSRALVIDPVAGPSVYYATYLGSGSGDTFRSIAVDGAGEAFITGNTSATNYPVSGSAYQKTFPNGVTTVGFVTALNAAGTGLKYSTFISGSGTTNVSDNGTLNGIAVDAGGSAFIGGQTDDPSFPSVKAFQATIPALAGAPSNYDHEVGIVFELSTDGSSLVYSSFLGGGDPYNVINAIAVDQNDNAYVTGTFQVYSTGGSHPGHFPTTAGVIWPNFNQPDIGAGFDDSFASKIAPPTSGNSSLSYSTIIGSGTAQVPLTYGLGIAVDSVGDAYVTGSTDGNIADHGGTITTQMDMTHVNRNQGEYTYNTFVVELNPGATQAVYVDYLGGNAGGNTINGTAYGPSTSPSGIKVTANGIAYVAGTTSTSNFETTSNALYPSARLAGVKSSVTNTPQSDGYITIIGNGGGSFVYSTYFNGTAVSSVATSQMQDGSLSLAGIALGPNGEFTVSGITDTTDFPALGANPASPQLTSTFPTSQGYAVYVTKFLPPLTTGGGLQYSVFAGGGGEFGVNGIASNGGSDVYVMFPEFANNLATGGAYDLNDSSGNKELVMRIQDPAALTTSISVGGQSAPTSSSPQQISLTSTLSASSTVNGGTVTYTVTNSSSQQVGSAVTSGIVSSNVAPATQFTLPANTPTGSYTIHASYLGAQGFLNTSGTGTLSVGVSTVGVTIASSPTGLSFTVSGSGCAPGSYTSSQTLQWTPGSSCTVAFSTPQAGTSGTRYVFNQWENGSTSSSRVIAAPSSTATYTASFTTQYQLTVNASPSAGGTATPTSGSYYNSGTVVQLGATANSGYAFQNWTGATVSNSSNPSTTITLNGPATVTANFIPVNTITSSPTGLSFTVSGTGCAAGSYTSPQTLAWVPGSSCTVTYSSPQAGTSGTQYAFNQWDNGSTSPSRMITAPSTPMTYTASFNTQYQLTTAASAGGTVSPTSGQFYNSGTVVNLTATPNTGYAFQGWTGSSAVVNPTIESTTITLTAPASVTANFIPTVTITSSPTGLSFSVTGSGCSPGSYTSPQTLPWAPGSPCTITFTTPQSGGTGTQYAFNRWENSSTSPSRMITAPSTPMTYTASFNTQYLLTASVSPGGSGTISPTTGYYNAGTVSVSATPNTGYVFSGFSGALSGTTNPQNLNLTGPMTVTANFLATQTINFPQIPDQLLINSPVTLNASASSGMAVTFSSNTPSVCTVSGSKATLLMTGTCSITASQSGGSGYAPASATQSFNVVPTSASFQTVDTSTQGNWKGVYGFNGYLIANDATNPPSYLPAPQGGFFPGGTTYTWVASDPTEARALQKAESTTDRIASTYYATNNSSFNISLPFNDNLVHQVALYLLDYDTFGRSETISILDPNNNNAVLSTKPFANFHNGTWAIWNIQGPVVIQVNLNGGLNPVVAGVFFSTVTTVAKPTVSITSPTANQQVSGTVQLSANAAPGQQQGDSIVSVQFQLDGSNLGGPITSGPPYTYSWPSASVSNGSHTLVAVATDSFNQTTTSAPVTFTVSNMLTNGATFLRIDTTTQGTWKGHYGSDGEVIPYDSSNPPGYATLNFGTAQLYEWTLTTDMRALQEANSTTQRIASTYYANPPGFTMDVNLTDGNTHEVALYFLDWDSAGRAETLTIRDATSQTILDTRSITGFVGGQYLVWNLKGHVTIQVTSTAGPNALVNGVFFAPPGT